MALVDGISLENKEENVDITFFDVVKSSGSVGIVIWIAIFTMWPVGIVLGIISIIAASNRKSKYIPSSFKILIITSLIYIFIGFLGAIRTFMHSFEVVTMGTGSGKASMLAFGISNSLYLLNFSLLNTMPFMLFIFISILILHFKEVPISAEELMSQDGEEL